jgi:sodium-dependent dicarboxylate transporter 2/3/5
MPRQTLADEYRRLGPTRYPEWVVTVVFGAMVVLWVTRGKLVLGDLTLFGWSEWLSQPDYITDGTVSIAMASLLFLIPARQSTPTMVMNWSTAVRLPWNIVLLFGGGFALAKGFEQSGLSSWLGNQLQGLGVLPLPIFLLLMCAAICFVSEFTSNTATTQLLLPILTAIAVQLQVHPLMILLPATIACSWGFMMPVGTPPNAIVFGTHRVRMVDMARVGIFVNLLSVAITVLAIWTWGRWVWGIDALSMPDWSR